MKNQQQIYYNWCESPAIKENTFREYLNVYNKIINKWSKDLFTPQSLLKKIEQKILHLNKEMPFNFKFNKNEIKQIIKTDYKYYKEFYNCILNNVNKDPRFPQFKIQILYLPNLLYYKQYMQLYFPMIFVKKVLKEFSKTNFKCKAQCFQVQNQLSCGCIIVLNGQALNIYDEVELETILDHELNHYFDIFNPNVEQLEKLKPSDKFNILAAKLGYNVNSQDFIVHILGSTEFYQMCCDVCNTLDFQKISYYDWLNMLTDNYLIDINRFNNLNINLQNILFFSFACRCLDKNRWQKLKKYVYDQLNTKFNILKSSKHLITDLLLRLKF